ncbi:MAG: alkaline phosphatase D family protein, partial [Verrucomicrobiota bacterium]
MDRRSFILATSSLAAAAVWSSRAVGSVITNPSFHAYPFSLGVASGDPSADGMVLWTRLAPDPLNGGGMEPGTVEVSWMIAEDEGFSKGVKKGKTFARHDWAHSVHVEVDGLKPDRWYWYQFRAGSEVSPVGRTRTMPAEGVTPDRLRFAFASCQHFETGFYTAYEHMVQEDLDLIIHLGDYIYEYKGREDRVRMHRGDEIMSVDDYRNRYAQYRSDIDLQAAHAAAPWLVTWDDHEVDNNYASDISEQLGTDREAFRWRRANAYKAYYEHMPLRRASLPQGPDMLLYRRVSFGNLADFF